MVNVWHENKTTMKWSLVETRGTPPSARYGHSACIHTLFGTPRMIIFGGYRKIRLNDLFEYDTELQKWREISPTNTAEVHRTGVYPGPRDCHSADIYQERYMIVCCGANGVNWLNDVFMYDILTEEWSLLIPKVGALPLGRAGHSSSLLGNDLIICGGWMGTRTLNDCWRFNLKTLKWTQIVYANTPPRPRDSHTSLIHYTKEGDPQLYIMGGGSSSKRHTGICIFDFKTCQWTVRKNTHFLRLAGHDGILTPDHKCIFFGGGDGVAWKRSLIQYDLQSDQWHKLKTHGRNEPPGAYGLSMVLYSVKERLVALCWGGGTGDKFHSELYALDLTHRYPMDIPDRRTTQRFTDCVIRIAGESVSEQQMLKSSNFLSSKNRTIHLSSSSAPPSSTPKKSSSSIVSHQLQQQYNGREEPHLL